jgi:hypothetical protein
MVELLFTTSTVWTVPPDWTNENIFEVYAGGGGATGIYYFGNTANFSGSNSGFAGGYNFSYNVSNLNPGDRVEISVGLAGPGGVGTGRLITQVSSGGSRFNFFQNFNFVGQAGGNTIVRHPNGSNVINASGGGPGIVTWTNVANQTVINQSYPGPNQPGAPLRLWVNATSPYVNRYTRYPPISDGLLVKVGNTFAAGGINASVQSDSFVQQAGQPGVVAISYISRTTHSPCVWIS